VSHNDMFDAARAAGSPIEQARSRLFMLHPETFAKASPPVTRTLSRICRRRGGGAGPGHRDTVSSVFAVFEPNFLRAMWEEGVAVRGAAAAAELYWDQVAGFARKYLAGAHAAGPHRRAG